MNILLQSIEASNVSHTISSVDDGRKLLYVNQAFCDTTGYSQDESVGRNCSFLQGAGTDPETVDRIRRALEALEPIDIEILNYRKDGTPFWNRLRMAPVYDESGTPNAFIGIQTDVTQIREQIIREQERQKLESLGVFAANICHEIKNALQPIRLMSEALQDWEKLSPEMIQKFLGIIAENVDIATNVTGDILSFSGNNAEKISNITVDELQRESERFIHSLIPSSVQFEVSLLEMPGHCVRINKQSFWQVLANLVSNALHAMDNQGNLKLIFSQESHIVPPGKPNRLLIALQDEGCGMDRHTQEKLFDLFFTTKPVGEGTGLGMSVCYGLVNAWGGTMEVNSEQGFGSTLTVKLPLFGE